MYARQDDPGEWRVHCLYGGKPLDGEPGDTITDALRNLGYKLKDDRVDLLKRFHIDDMDDYTGRLPSGK